MLTVKSSKNENNRNLYSQLTVGTAVFTLLVCLLIYMGSLIHENQVLKKSITELANTNAQQRSLLNDKTQELDRLQSESSAYRESVSQKIKEFTEALSNLTNGFVSGKSTSKTNRSGDRTSITPAQQAQSMEQLLSSLNDLYSNAGVPAAELSDHEINLSDLEAKLNKYLDTLPTLWPAGSGGVNDYFGYRKDPFTRRLKYHDGIDVDAEYGANIKAAASGTVILSKRTIGYGKTVEISHGQGITTLYGHASQLLVKVGQKIKKGDVIAKVGSSGRSTGPHLHFEVRLYGTAVDPLQYLTRK